MLWERRRHRKSQLTARDKKIQWIQLLVDVFLGQAMIWMLRCSAKLLAFCMFFIGSASHAAPLCQHGDRSIQLTILPPSGEPLSLQVGTAYFDQRFIPRDGSSREGLLLKMQATDFAPWPRGLRPHSSEGPMLSYLLTPFLPFDVVADRTARSEAGYRYTEEVTWADAPGPFGLFVPTAPPPPNPQRGQLVGKNDIYISRNVTGVITDIISCRRPGREPFQSCSHLIEAGDMDIQIRYAPEFLPDWERLSSGARDFLNCMVKG